jgi:hypothetical protein
MSIARKILLGLAWLYVLGIVLQFFFAGLLILGFGDAEELEDYRDLHEGFGYAVLHLYPILMVVAAAVGRVGRNLLLATIALAVIVFVQPIWVAEFRGEFLGSMHVLGALVIFVLAHHVAQQTTRLVRGESVATA